MTTIKQMVIKVLQESEETRNDDRLLYLKVLEMMNLIEPHGEIFERGGYIIDLNNIDKMPSFESIRRRRQEIQNDEHRFLPTEPEVLLNRKLYYELCPYELLSEEHQPQEILKSVCKRCPKHGTDRCNLIYGVPAGVF